MNGLRWLRIRCNLSTSELADQLGVTRQAGEWQEGYSGEKKEPNGGVLWN